MRVQLDFAPTAMKRLQDLKATTEAVSYAEVVKNALRLYEALIEQEKAGREVLTRDKDGTLELLKVFV